MSEPDIFANAHAAAEATRTEAVDLIVKIEETKAEIEAVRKAPLALADIEARVDDGIAFLQKRLDFAVPGAYWLPGSNASDAYNELQRQPGFLLMAALVPDLLKDLLVKSARQVAERKGGHGLPVAERPAKLAELEAKLAPLEQRKAALGAAARRLADELAPITDAEAFRIAQRVRKVGTDTQHQVVLDAIREGIPAEPPAAA